MLASPEATLVFSKGNEELLRIGPDTEAHRSVGRWDVSVERPDARGLEEGLVLYRFALRELIATDEGHYSAVAHNPLGRSVVSSCELRLLAEDTLPAGAEQPFFVEELQSVAALPGSSVRFECGFEASPGATVRFFKNRTHALDPTRVSALASKVWIEVDSEGGHASLIVSRVELTDVGFYSCVIENRWCVCVWMCVCTNKSLFNFSILIINNLILKVNKLQITNFKIFFQK